MDKEEFRVKLGEINNLVEKQDYKGAMNIVDSIDWRRVKNVRTLCVVGEIYAANKRYRDSKDIFLLAYHRAPIGKNILYRLIEVSLKMGEVDEAMDFYEEYVEVAPNDNTQYILKYKIYKARNASVESLIKILENYKEKEFTEKWAYELAKLYYRSGDKEKCSDLCDEMILWFSGGKYVAKALELKSHFSELTDMEKKIYEEHINSDDSDNSDGSDSQDEVKIAADVKRKSQRAPKQDQNSEDEAAPAIENISIDERDVNNAESLQEKITKGIRDIFGIRKKDFEPDDEDEMEEEVKDEKSQKEMIRSSSSKNSSAAVPELEPENIKSANLKSSTKKIEIPSLNIPENLKKMQEKPELKKVAEEFEENEEDFMDSEEEKDLSEEDAKEFNLEDTILAAASAQGIEIPEKDPEEDEFEDDDEFEEEDESEETELEEELEEKSEPEEDPEEDPESEEDSESDEGESYFVEEEPEVIPRKKQSLKEIPVLEEEEFLSEDILREAEEEFLNGPSASGKNASKKKETVKKQKPDKKSKDSLKVSDEIDEIPEEDPDDEPTENKKVQKKSARKIRKKQIPEEVYQEEEDAEDIGDADEDSAEYAEENLSEEEKLEKFIESKDPRKLNPDELIPRENELTDSEIKLFTYFVKVPGMKDQLLDTLFDVQMAAADKTSKTGNIIVMGGRETGKTRLISSLIPAICEELNMEASKVAYVFADQINDKDISRIVSKLAGGFLVIEDANQLSPLAAGQLDKAMEFRTDGLTVIVEDEKIGMRKFMARFPKLAKKFTSVINIPVFTNDELVNFARIYTKENGYIIDQMGMLALYNLISANQKEDEPMNIGAVKNLIDAAITKSQGGIRKLKRNISKKHTDHDGYVILYEKDFDI